MDKSKLNQKWKTLAPPSTGYVSIRIDGKCIPDLFIGINEDGNRCLILEIPSSVKVRFRQLNRENLRAFYHKQEMCIILELLDEFYHELFDELIISLYNVLKDITDPDIYTESFVLTINKWGAFLAGTRGNELSEAEIRGVIGELVCLEYYINENDTQVINSILSGWRGPFDEIYDFEFDEKAVEVKTKAYRSSEVQISNENQLDPIPGKGLNLFVVSLISHSEGINIEGIISCLRQIILSGGGDITILYTALAEKNLTPATFLIYQNYRYKIPGIEIYNAKSEDFPALRKSDLGNTVRKLRYKLNLERCTEFQITKTHTIWK